MKKTRLPALCKICGNSTEALASVITSGLPVYCSKECKSKRYEHNCGICGKYFRNNKADTRTCGRECQTKLRRLKTVGVECYYCKKAFDRPTSDVYKGKRVFCSQRCGNNQYSLDNPSRYGTNWGAVKGKRMALDNHKCTRCEATEDLEVHHKVKLTSFDNPNEANYTENLETLCKPCHRIVEKRYSLNI